MADPTREEIRQLLQERLENIKSYAPEEQQTIRDAASRFLGGSGGSPSARPYDPSTRGVRLNDRAPQFQPAGVPEHYGVDDAMGNLSAGLHGVATAMTPAVVPAVMSNPIATLLKLGAATGVQKGVEAGGTAMGAPGAGALVGDAAASLVPGGVDKINDLPMLDGVTRPNYYQGGKQGIYDKMSNLNPKDLIGFLMHPKTKLTKMAGKAIMDAIMESAGEAGKKGGGAPGGAPMLPPEVAPAPYRNPYTGDPAQATGSEQFFNEGVGSGQELDAGIKYPAPVDPVLPKQNLDPYGAPQAPQDPYTRLLTSDPRVHTPPVQQGVGAGPEVSAGIKAPPPAVEKPLTKAQQRVQNATTLDPYGNPKSTEPRPVTSSPTVETPPPLKRGVGAGTMEYEDLVGAVSKRLNLPSAEQAGEVPPSVGTSGTGLPKDLTDAAQRMLAQRDVKASVLAKYFKDAKLTAADVEKLARESPAELKNHAKNAGYSRGISPESLEVLLSKLKSIQK